MNFQVFNGSKYLVFFFDNHTVISPCYQNTNICPYSSYCQVNASWTAVPSLCVCRYWTGFSGDQCRTPIPVWGGILFTQAGLIILICFLAAMVVLRDFIRLNLHGTLSKKPFTAFTTTLVFNFFASLSLSCYYINTLATFTDSFNSSFATFCLISAFFCLSLSGLNISLVWSEIAINVRKMSLRASQNVNRYRGVLVFYYLAFFILALYFAIENETVIFQIVCVPSIVFVIISYFIAYIRIKRVIHEHSSSRDSQGYEKEMRVIARAALRYSMLAFCGLFFQKEDSK